jgi:hypothetical protein
MRTPSKRDTIADCTLFAKFAEYDTSVFLIPSKATVQN